MSCRVVSSEARLVILVGVIGASWVEVGGSMVLEAINPVTVGVLCVDTGTRNRVP